jgi:LAS superfamily LD-carboxypeptidase LdcB
MSRASTFTTSDESFGDGFSAAVSAKAADEARPPQDSPNQQFQVTMSEEFNGLDEETAAEVQEWIDSAKKQGRHLTVQQALQAMKEHQRVSFDFCVCSF